MQHLCIFVILIILGFSYAQQPQPPKPGNFSRQDSSKVLVTPPVNGPNSVVQQKRHFDDSVMQSKSMQTQSVKGMPDKAGGTIQQKPSNNNIGMPNTSMAVSNDKVIPETTERIKEQNKNAGRQSMPISANTNPYPIDLIPVADTIKIPVLDFKNTDIRDIMRAIGMQYNVNIYLESDVSGTLSLYLVDIPVKKAIDFIAKRANLAYVVENGIVKVFKYTAPAALPEKPPVVFHVHDGLLDIDLKGIMLGEAAQMFVDSTGLNVVADAKIDKSITCHIKNLKPDKAIKVLCESNGFEASVSEGIYYISKPAWGDDKAEASSQLKRLSVSVSKANKISIEVNNAALDQVIRNIITQSGINVIIYENITGTVSAKLDSVGLDEVLRFLLQNTKFTFWKDKNVYFIGSREMSEQKTTMVIPFKHIMADEATITKVLPPNIAKDAIIKFDKEHNSVIVIGSFDIVAQTQEFLENVDQPIPQVLIEALVVDFNLNKIREYGCSMFTQSSKDTSGSWNSENFLPTLTLKPGRQRTQRILNNILKNLGISQIINLPENFRTSIHALESASIVKVHSTPQIATINGNPASITIGETRYYKLKKETQAAITNNNSSVIGTDERFEVLKFNTELQVTPWIMDKGYVMVKIRPEFNIPRTSSDATTPPNVDTRVIESMVRLRNGQTIVLGGQRQTENVESRSGIPLLSSIPVLGWLFSSKSITKTETQMMIFLTPHVYYGDDNAVAPDEYFGAEVNKILDTDKGEKKQKNKGKEQVKEQGGYSTGTKNTVKTDSITVNK